MRDPIIRRAVLAFLAVAVAVAAPAADAPAQLQAGEVVPAFEAEAVAGGQQRVDYDETTVLLFFSSGCPHCHRQIPQWNRAFERRGKGVKIIGMLMDREPPGFFTAIDIAFPVLRAPAGSFRQTFKIHRVPTAVRLGVGGKVEEVVVGDADQIRLGQLFRP